MATFGNSDNTVGVLVKTEADTSGIAQTENAVDGLNSSVDDSTKKHTDWAGSIEKAGAISVGLLGTIGLVTKGAIDQASAYQQNRVAFEVMLGSADKAKTLLRQISDFAAQTPFELPQVVEGAKNLLAFGFSASQIIPTFSMLGNIASAVGTDKLPNIVAVFGQIKVAGRAMTQDLMQFTSAGVPIIDELAKHYGKTTEDVRKLTEQGKVGFSDVQAALEQLGGPTGKWGDLMAKQSQTFGGTMSNVNDQLGRILRQAVGIGPDGDIRKGSLFDIAVKGANSLLSAMTTLTPMFDSIAHFFETNKLAVQGLVGALGGLLLGTIVAIVVAIGWIPFAIVGASMAIGAAVAVIIANLDNIKKFFGDIGKNIGDVANSIGLFFRMLGDFFSGGDPTLDSAHANNKAWQDFARTLSTIQGTVIGVFTNIGNFFSSIANTMKNVWNSTINSIVNALNYFHDHFFEVIGFAIGFILTLPIKLVAAFVWMSVTAIKIAGDFVGDVANNFVNGFENMINWLVGINWGQVFNNILLAIVGTMISVGNAIVGAFNNTINWFTHIDWGGIFASIGRAAANVGNDIWSAISGAWNKVMGINWGAVLVNIGKGLGNSIIDLVNGAIKGAFSGVPVLKDHVPQLPHFAQGVRNFSGGLAVVGEQGPEIIDLPRGSNVYTNQQSKQIAAKGGVTMNNTYHIYNQTDFDAALKEQGWRIANAT